MLVVALVVFGVVLRIQGIGFPAFFTFDEELFARPALGYLAGIADGNDHPPLGKLVIAVGLLLFGSNPVGWRFSSLVFGLFTLVIAKWLGTELFQSKRAGWIAAAAFAADGFFIGYSRCGLMDGILTCVILWSFLAAVVAESYWGVLSSAVLVGLATSVKWSGAFAVFPAALAVLLLGRVRRPAVLLFALSPVVHILVWIFGLWLTGTQNDLLALFRLMKGLFEHHQSMGLRDNGLASPWYSWPILWHPIVVKLSPHGDGSTYASTVSNLALWAAVTVSLLAAPILAVTNRVLVRLGKQEFLEASLVRALLLSEAGWLALYSPWMVGRGKYTFHYHYLPSWGFGLIMAVGLVAHLEKAFPRLVLGFMSLTAAFALWFAPVWGELRMSEHDANLRLWFVNWRP